MKSERDSPTYNDIATAILVEKRVMAEAEGTPVSKLRVFVSSTWSDLQKEREAIRRALDRIRTITFSGIEHFGRPGTSKEDCLAEVRRADVYVGIFAHLYGDIDLESGSSMTELEYEEARKRGIPRLIYLMDESVPILRSNIEQDPKAVYKLEALRHQLWSQEDTVRFFTSPDDLASKVVDDLHDRFAITVQAPVVEKTYEVEAPHPEEVGTPYLEKELEREVRVETVWGTWTLGFLACFLGGSISIGLGLLLDIPRLVQLSTYLLSALIPFLVFAVVLRKLAPKDGRQR